MGQDDLTLPLSLSNLVQEHPLTRLKALRELRLQIDQLLDALQADLVEQALVRASLADVAKQLGISTSKAQRDYGDLLPEKKRRRAKTVDPAQERIGEDALDSG